MSPRLHATGGAARELLARYAAVFKAAWAQRHAMQPAVRLPHEAEFLPAALELQERPAPPAPRVVMWLLMLFALIALVWSVFGKIDVVATAQGHIIPNDKTKIIQPLEAATVRAVLVKDGQVVKAGQALIELDATLTAADVARLESEARTARLQEASAQAFLNASRNANGIARPKLAALPALPGLPGIGPAELAKQQSNLDSQWQEFRARALKLDAEVHRRQAEIASTSTLVSRLEQSVPLAQQRARDFAHLAQQNFVSKHALLEREQARMDAERELAVQTSRLAELRAALLESQRQKAVLVAETQRGQQDLLREAQVKAAALEQELIKARQRDRLMRLTAPVDGTVQQLAVHTVGGVVTPAQPLLVIVPNDHPLEVEAFVENKDIGFVEPGQRAEVKVETFPFTKYGTIPATLTDVSNDAVSDEKRGLIFTAQVRLERTTILLENKTIALSPGMAVTVEIKTGQRRVIEYFLSPLLQTTSESLRER